ncbi:hypothetical protein GIB67_042478, partial [Kingdonia uniflora]
MLNHRKLWKPFSLIQGKTLVPFELMRESIKILKKHKRTFSHIDNKKIGLGGAPGMLSTLKSIHRGINEGLE